MRVLYGLVFSSLVLAQASQAQELIGIKIEPSEVTAGKPVQIVVDLKASSVPNGACGLLVNFGDGTSQQVRAENSSLPVRLTHTYSNTGAVTISAEGKIYARGLNSVLGCFGKNQTGAIAVRAEDPSEREAAELAAKNEAVKRATADRKAAEASAKTAANDRAATEAAAQKAKAERAAAEAAAKKAAIARAAAEQVTAKPQLPPAPTPPVKRADTTSAQPPAAATATPPPAVKPAPPKAKSSLDL